MADTEFDYPAGTPLWCFGPRDGTLAMSRAWYIGRKGSWRHYRNIRTGIEWKENGHPSSYGLEPDKDMAILAYATRAITNVSECAWNHGGHSAMAHFQHFPNAAKVTEIGRHHLSGAESNLYCLVAYLTSGPHNSEQESEGPSGYH